MERSLSFNPMNNNTRIQIVQLADGRALMRIEDEKTSLSVERNLSPELPLVAQKTKIMRLFTTLLINDAAAS
jgi:hypothetical protein